jgi:hypothetical protein
MQRWASGRLYTGGVNLGDAVADALNRPMKASSWTRVFRSLF